jgi:hypothetical protein
MFTESFASESLTNLLDGLGSAARGNLVFRGASEWQLLAPGTAGNPLISGGAAGNPSWASYAIFSASGFHLTITQQTVSDIPIKLKAAGAGGYLLKFYNSSDSELGYIGNNGAISVGNIYCEYARANSKLGITTDTWFERDGAGIFAQRNGANAQILRLYNTYTSASDYERASLNWTSNIFTITTANAGGGTLRGLRLGVGTDYFIDFGVTTAGVATLPNPTTFSNATIKMTALPTSNPGAGILWNDSGTIKLGT